MGGDRVKYFHPVIRGPLSVTDHAIVRWDGTSGLLVQDSSATIDDSGNIVARDLTLTQFAGGNETIDEILDDTLNRGVLDAITVTADAGVGSAGRDISWTTGEVWDHGNSTVVDTTAADNQTCDDDDITYLYWASGTGLTKSTTAPSGNNVHVAEIYVQDGVIWGVEQFNIVSEREAEVVGALSDMFPAVVVSGLIVSPADDLPFDVDMTAGVWYHHGHEKHTVSALTSPTMTRWFHAVGGAWDFDTSNEIDEDNYDTGNGLALNNVNLYYRSSFFLDDSDALHWIYPTAGYNTVAQAIGGVCPSKPDALEGFPRSTCLVLRGNAADLPATGDEQWIDTRPRIGSVGPGAVSDHGDLAGLGDPDHTALGTMTADIDMNNSYQVVNLQAPAASGEALRQTTNITEADLEQLTDGSDTTLHDHGGISENTAARHAEAHNAASHSDIASSGSAIDAAVSASHSNAADHTQGTDTTLGTMTADIDFGGYKAIAMACDNGATLPTIGLTEGQWFLHAMTNRRILYQYSNSTWQPHFLYNIGGTILYVSKDGSAADNLTKGDGSGADAFATIQYAVDAIPGVVGDDVTISIAAGTYQEEVTIRGKNFTGNYTIALNGAMSSEETGTATAGAQLSSGAAAHVKATLTDGAKAWNASDYVGMLLVITGGTGDGQERFIYDNTGTVLSIIGSWDTVPNGTSTYTIKSFDTVIDGENTRTSCVTVRNQLGVELYQLKTLNGYTRDIWLTEFSFAYIHSCFCEDETTGKGDSKRTILVDAKAMAKIAVCYIQYDAGIAGSICIRVDNSTVGGAQQLTDSWLSEGGDGLTSANVGYIKCAGIFIEGVTRDGVNCETNSYILMDDLIVTGAGRYGIKVLQASVTWNFSGCEFDNSTSHGVYISGQSQHTFSSTTRVSNNGGWGINTSVLSYGSNATGPTFAGNTSGTQTADATSVNT